MKVGLQLRVGFSHWTPFTRLAEDVGFESVWIPEHLILPVQMSGRPGTAHEGTPPISANTPAWDPWVQIAHLAASTNRIRFGTNVYNIGLRHPFVTARALMTADLVSEGRIEFGIGASWLAEEWRAMELDFDTRGRRVDESIQIIKRLFSEKVVEHSGEFFNFPPVQFEPKPVQDGGPRFHIGGDSNAAMRRAATLADGWIPMAQTPETLGVNIKKLARLREEAGRTTPLEITAYCLNAGDVDTLKRYRDMGVNRVVVVPWDRAQDGLDRIKRFGDEVLPELM